MPAIARDEKWEVTFDSEEGTLFYSPKKIADGSELYQVNDEYALYLDRNMRPRGVMIEYFKDNFLKHHRALEKLDETSATFRMLLESLLLAAV